MGNPLRFDDTLETVLAADLSTPYGAQSAWRQLVDLIGRRRAPVGTRAMATLRALRPQVPLAVRVASARALDQADPPTPLVRLFATDDAAAALPVLQVARMTAADWIELLPDLSPAGRHVLRNRRDLPPAVHRALEAFGPVDFVLPDASRDGAAGDDSPAGDIVDTVNPQLSAPGGIASGPDLPQAQDMNHARAFVADDADPALRPLDAAEAGAPGSDGEGPFAIAEVVARIDAFWREREAGGAPAPRAVTPGERFRFETDSQGVIRWVEGVSRAPLVGLALEATDNAGGSTADGIAAGAFRRRAPFRAARLWVTGDSDAAGDWRISGVPVFEPETGRFAGYRGTARRPRSDERAERGKPADAGGAAESLRELVHELRTPTNAIAGFAEMIEAQMLGPVPAAYRARAEEIRNQARALLGAIDDLDLAARIDSAALSLVPTRVPLRPLLAEIAEDLAPLLDLRGAQLALPIAERSLHGDRRAIERLLSRLLSTLISASASGERIGIDLGGEGEAMVAIAIDRPRALADYPGDAVLGIDDESEDDALLGTGFALRLARNLARELGGSLAIEADRLTLRLPAFVSGAMGQAHRN